MFCTRTSGKWVVEEGDENERVVHEGQNNQEVVEAVPEFHCTKMKISATFLKGQQTTYELLQNMKILTKKINSLWAKLIAIN